MDLVSVVVPIYNVEKYLDRCVESIVNQTYRHLEIILVDDGSPDNCPHMCDQWAKRDNRIRVIHKRNAGQGIARNTGIENANGEFICFFDSDDYVDEKLIEKAHARITETDAEMLIYGCYQANPEKEQYIPRIPEPDKEIYRGTEVQELFLPMFLAPDIGNGKHAKIPRSAWGAMYRLSLIRQLNWCFVSEREIISEDIYSHLVLYKNVKKVVILKEALYYYCENGNSFSRAYRSDRFEKNKFFYIKCCDFCDEADLPYVVKRSCMEPFVSFTIATLKQEVSSGQKQKQKIKHIRQMLDDALLQQVLVTKKHDKMNRKKRLLFWAMRKKLSYLCYLFVWVQNVSQQ